jgi:hypothetical protein
MGVERLESAESGLYATPALLRRFMQVICSAFAVVQESAKRSGIQQWPMSVRL